MAIQLRRGVYNNFDPSKLLPGEVAVVQSGDPNTRNGKAVYIATLSGEIKRFAFVEDVEEVVYNVADGIAEEINDQVAENVTAAQTAANNAANSASDAQTAAASIINNIDGSLSDTAIQLLETILNAAVYTSDQSANIDALIEELSSDSNVDSITVENGVMTILGLANTPTLSNGILSIA